MSWFWFNLYIRLQKWNREFGTDSALSQKKKLFQEIDNTKNSGSKRVWMRRCSRSSSDQDFFLTLHLRFTPGGLRGSYTLPETLPEPGSDAGKVLKVETKTTGL